jgi:hypothetical protein
MITLDTFKLTRAEIERDMAVASAALQSFPQSELGLTPDRVKALPEWQSAKRSYDVAFSRLRAWNAAHLKRFAGELQEERRNRRAIA